MNRCVVVTNDDYEMEHYPARGRWRDGDRNYPSVELECSEDAGLSLIKVVLTSGYYCDACIDYIQAKHVKEKLASPYFYTGYNRKEMIDELQYFFPCLSARTINKCLKGCRKDSDEYEIQLEKAFEVLENEVVKRESAIADAIVDDIKKRYGYREYTCVDVFSNGEAIYEDLDAIRERARKKH